MREKRFQTPLGRLLCVAALFLAAWPYAPSRAAEKPTMTLLSFDGASLPVDKAGASYPNQYQPEGTAVLSLDQSDAVSGKSLRFEVTKGRFYAQFNAHNPDGTRGFAREYVAQPESWQPDTFNRLSFWIQCPTNAVALRTDGRPNMDLGTYVKRIKDVDRRSDETGGNHWYHQLDIAPTGTWTKVILNMHPHHYRGANGQTEHHNQPHPTREPGYNYFDTLTRFYVSAEYGAPESYPAVYRLDEIQFYREGRPENDEQVYSIAATILPAESRLILTWSRDKDRNKVQHEVRYALSDIHDIGWDRALPAPEGIVSPRGWQGYNVMSYTTTKLLLAKRRVLFLAIKPADSKLFSQMDLPLMPR